MEEKSMKNVLAVPASEKAWRNADLMAPSVTMRVPLAARCKTHTQGGKDVHW